MMLLAFIFVGVCAFVGGVIVGTKLPSPATFESKNEPLIGPGDYWLPEKKVTKRKGKGKRKGK